MRQRSLYSHLSRKSEFTINEVSFVSERIYLKGGTVVFEDTIKNSTVIINGSFIEDADYKGEIPKDSKVIDASDKIIAPGIVEIHSHGGGGFDFMDCSVEAFDTIAKTHISHGVTSMLPTTVSASFDEMKKFFGIYRNISKKPDNIFLGLHLEGPYISGEMKGAHNPAYIRCPSEYEVDELMYCAGDIIKMCTAAPEIDGIHYMSKRMKEKGITLSAGHSYGTFSDIERALELGFSHITHLYSNTPGVRKINQRVNAGILEAAYYFDDIYIELIGDGRHVPKEVLRLALKTKGADKINVTSDSMRAAGTDLNESYLGVKRPENRVIIEDGVAKLPDRSFYAGSIATGNTMLKWLVNECFVSLNDAFKMLSLTPAAVIGEHSRIGSIVAGKDADIIVLDSDLNIQNVLKKGTVIK